MEFVLSFNGEREAHSSTTKPRQIRKHTKSRGACQNCRLRRVKCDETKPDCLSCAKYQVHCNYCGATRDALQVCVTGASKALGPSRPLSETNAILSNLNTSPRSRSIRSLGTSCLDPVNHFSAHDLQVLRRWKWRTMPSLGSGDVTAYENAYTKLTFSHAFLFHVVLTVTLVHDKYFIDTKDAQLENAISYHWAEGASLLNQKLCHGFAPDERDALWACAGMLACLGFASYSARVPAEAWPLKLEEGNDLDWLKMCQGKKEIWKLADPTRGDSLFSPLTANFGRMSYVPPLLVRDATDTEDDTDMQRLARFCNIDTGTHTATQGDNTYYGALAVLTTLRPVRCDASTMMQFLSFFGCMHSSFGSLLQAKDPAAMLLLSFWYAKVSHYKQWWLWPRADGECQSICMFLSWHHANDERVARLVRDARHIYDFD